MRKKIHKPKAKRQSIRSLSVQCGELFRAFLKWNKPYSHRYAPYHLEIYADGSGRVCDPAWHWPVEFKNFQEGLEKLNKTQRRRKRGATGNGGRKSKPQQRA